MLSPFTTKSAESFALASAVTGVLIAGLLTLIPAVSFGTFWQMAGILVGADLVVYAAMKLGWIRAPRSR